MLTESAKFDCQGISLLSEEYGIPKLDVMLIALNRFGARADVEDKRLRFKLRPSNSSELFYLAICINTFDSPFYMCGKDLFLGDTVVGEIIDVEKDTCDTTYFRRNKTELTLNSNMRSQCAECTFCGTYNLEPEDRVDMSSRAKIAEFVDEYLRLHKVKDLSDLVRVTICTGCFINEMELCNHIMDVNDAFQSFGFNKRIRHIGSQIRSEEAMAAIHKSIPQLSVSLTLLRDVDDLAGDASKGRAGCAGAHHAHHHRPMRRIPCARRRPTPWRPSSSRRKGRKGKRKGICKKWAQKSPENMMFQDFSSVGDT